MTWQDRSSFGPRPVDQHNFAGGRADATITVKDAAGNPVPEVVVDFAVVEGDGTVDEAFRVTNAFGGANFTRRFGRSKGDNALLLTIEGFASVSKKSRSAQSV